MRARGMAGVAVGAVLLVAGVLYVVGYAMTSDSVPRHASVAGIPIGGLSRTEAVDTLSKELAERAAADVTVTVAGAEYTVSPARAGLGVDYAASVDVAGAGKSWDPRRIVEVLRGGSAHDAVVTVDQAKMTAAVAKLADQADHRAADATIGYRTAGSKVTIRTKAGVDAVNVDRRTATDVIIAAYRQARPAELAATVTPPEITTAEVEAVATSFAEPAVAAPVKITIKGSDSFSVSPAMIAESVSFPAVDGKPSPKVDAKVLRQQAEPAIDDLDLDEPVDAKIEIKDEKPAIIPSKDGVGVTAEDLAAAVTPVLPETGEKRSVTVTSTGAEADFSTQDAKKLKITEVVAEFTTAFPYAEYRNTNLGLAAKKINNTLVEPDAIFSLNDTLGPRDRKYGWVDGYVIQGGKLKKELAGGISQSATTTYNAGFFAGMKDIEHHPHSLYFDRYPAGRESTIYYGSLDMRFQNDTPYGVLMQAFIKRSTGVDDPGSITVRVWSTTYHQIKTATPTKSDFTYGRTITDDSPDCEYQPPIAGFTARFYRAFFENGKEVRRENYRWTYDPGDEIRCT